MILDSLEKYYLKLSTELKLVSSMWGVSGDLMRNKWDNAVQSTSGYPILIVLFLGSIKKKIIEKLLLFF